MKRKAPNGYTLIEVVCVSVMLVFVLGAMYSLLETGLRSWDQGEQQVEKQQNVRVAVNRLVQEVRKAAGIAASPLSDSDSLYLTDQEGNTIWYYLHSNGDLRRAVRQKGGINFSGHNPVASCLKTVEFIYNRTQITESSLVTVKIVGTDPQEHLYTLVTSVKIRIHE